MIKLLAIAGSSQRVMQCVSFASSRCSYWWICGCSLHELMVVVSFHV